MRHIIALSAIVLALLASSCTSSNEALLELQSGWENPPQGARTQVWWHWMNGNITKDGIEKDIAWFKRIGLGGFHTFDAAMNSPVIVNERLIYMTDGWKDAFRHAIQLADENGLEVAIASSPGWSSTGGPWVTAEDAMEKLVWRTIYAEGGRMIDLALPEAFTSTGTFQNAGASGSGSADKSKQHYEDIAVIAVKVPASQKTAAELGAAISASSGAPSLALLTDEDVDNGFQLSIDERTGYAWIGYEFPQPVTIYGVRYAGGEGLFLMTSENGRDFTKVCDIESSTDVAQSTVAIPVTTSRYFRVCYPNPKPAVSAWGFGGASKAPKFTTVTELELLPYSRVHHAEDKAAFSEAAKAFPSMESPQTGETFVQSSNVMDITSYVKDGRISWNAPEGKWKIYRFGWSLTGKQNHPAPAEATGLEVNKLDPDAWTRFFRHYIDMYKEATGGMIGQKGIQYILTDSYEAGIENWTPKMFEEFASRRGYDLHAWLPSLAGEIIDDPEKTDQFLFDYRVTLNELFAENYDRISEIAINEYGMKGRYTESHENGKVFPGDGATLKRSAEIPMSAMWVNAPWISYDKDETGHWRRSMYKADDRESASVAHIYGQNVAAAESMTSASDNYANYPGKLKETADDEMSSGINRFIIHESAHQPSDDHVPGTSLSGIGQIFTRHETWAEMAESWISYLSRSSFMLQAGKNVADILYYYGEDNNVTTEFGYADNAPQVPNGYQWDYLGSDALMTQISATKDGFMAKGGTTYRVLWMDRNMDRVSVPVLRKISEFAKSGAYIGGKRPKAPASLSDDKAEFEGLVRDIYETGRTNVIETANLQELLDKAGVQQDAAVSADMRFLHRTLRGAEVYWINKPAMDYKDVTISFRTEGMEPSLWHPETGVQEPVTYKVVGDRTEVSFSMVPQDAVFIVFSGKGKKSQAIAPRQESTLMTVSTPWTVRFQAKRGAPESAVFQSLKSYTEFEEFGIKYFSGVASYDNTINVAGTEGQTVLDLGEVQHTAEVWVNGEYCGRAWKQPYRVDITKAVREGENQIEIKVANPWINRLVGDQQPDCPEKVAYADNRAATPMTPLEKSGLIGPVKVVSVK